MCRQAGSLNITLYAFMLIILRAQELDFVKFLMETQVLLECAPIQTLGRARLSFSWISVFPHLPPSGRQRPFLWPAPLARFSTLSAAAHWASLFSHIKHQLFVTPFRGFLGFLLYPSLLTEYQILYFHLSIRTALNNHFYAISDKHFPDFHMLLLKEAVSSSL